jgi:hypothetical protein
MTNVESGTRSVHRIPRIAAFKEGEEMFDLSIRSSSVADAPGYFPSLFEGREPEKSPAQQAAASDLAKRYGVANFPELFLAPVVC